MDDKGLKEINQQKSLYISLFLTLCSAKENIWDHLYLYCIFFKSLLALFFLSMISCTVTLTQIINFFFKGRLIKLSNLFSCQSKTIPDNISTLPILVLTLLGHRASDLHPSAHLQHW